MNQMPVPVASNRFVPVQGITLPLESCGLEVDARGGLARVRLVQRFANTHAEPLSVTYKLPLPADAAVSGFSFRIGDRVIKGVVEGRKKARETFERAILSGRSAALLEQDRSSLFTQEIGNIPPGQAVFAIIDIDQPLAWLHEGSWEWRFPLAAAPRYLGAGPIEGNVTIATADGEIGARASLALTIRDSIAEGRSPESPSHPLVCSRGVQSFSAELGSGNRVALDRDIVVRWPAAKLVPGITIDVARPREGALADRAFALLTIVPPAPEAKAASVPRDLTLLIDTSGSMSGEPLAQAKRVCCALVDALQEGDQLEMIEFSSSATSFRSSPEPVTNKLKVSAIAWIKNLSASGGTEMLSGVQHAMKSLRPGSQRQVLLITDGLVGMEKQIVQTLLKELPASCRLHSLGVGSAVNRSLLAPIARAGRGIEAIVGLGEDPERAAARLLAHTVAPALVEVQIEGAVKQQAPRRAADVFAGSPLRVALEIEPKGGEIVVRGRTATGEIVQRLRVDSMEFGHGSEAVTKLFAREMVEDLEVMVSAGEGRDVDATIEALGTTFGIATRLTSWVAVSEEETVDPQSPTRHIEQPHELPYGMSAEGLGLRQAGAPAPGFAGNHVGAPRMVEMARHPAPAEGRARAVVRRKTADEGADFDGGPPALMGPPPAPPRGGLGRRAESEADMPAPPPPMQAQAPAKAAMPMEPEPYVADEAAEFEERSAPLEQSKKKSDSLFDQAKRKMKEVFAGKPKPAAKGEASASLRGKLVRFDDVTFVIEITSPPGGLELKHVGITIEVTLEDGTVVTAELLPRRSTREGEYGAGMGIKIGVGLASAPASKVTSILVKLPSGVTIEAH